jgi:uncharacterized protein YeaO (DUF488 family)
VPKHATADVKLKRAYDTVARSDGRRILVDRIWPRGIARDALRIADWIKEAAPSPELRKWFGHEPARWAEFKRRYFQELDRQPDVLCSLVEKSCTGTVTLIFAAKDAEHNNAAALREYLERHKPRAKPRVKCGEGWNDVAASPERRCSPVKRSGGVGGRDEE